MLLLNMENFKNNFIELKYSVIGGYFKKIAMDQDSFFINVTFQLYFKKHLQYSE